MMNPASGRKATSSETVSAYSRSAPSRLLILGVALGSLVGTGCRSFNYTMADLEREARQMSGIDREICQNGCWHTAHGFQPGYRTQPGGRYGP